MPIKINRRVDLGFLGDEYADSFLIFHAMSLIELEVVQAEIDKVKEDGTKSLEYIRKQMADRFVSGKIAQDGSLAEIKPEDLGDLPIDVFLESFEQIRGKVSPKD